MKKAPIGSAPAAFNSWRACSMCRRPISSKARPSSGQTVNGFAEPDGNSYVVDFLSTNEGLQLNRAFAAIKDPKVRKKILDLVLSLAAGAE